MGDSDLIVDYSELESLKKNFATLSREFNNCGSNQDSMGDAYGSYAIRNAMEDFADNWDDHRKELTDQLKKTEEHVKKIIKGFNKVDNGEG
ncbi:hypothetical protein [Streptomyces boninensis]|uniref:hypothetical protein n=1 Tax=Streptomyces boninensis TaxID=2039455 RepID=UPI003B20C651